MPGGRIINLETACLVRISPAVVYQTGDIFSWASTALCNPSTRILLYATGSYGGTPLGAGAETNALDDCAWIAHGQRPTISIVKENRFVLALFTHLFLSVLFQPVNRVLHLIEINVGIARGGKVG